LKREKKKYLYLFVWAFVVVVDFE